LREGGRILVAEPGTVRAQLLKKQNAAAFQFGPDIFIMTPELAADDEALARAATFFENTAERFYRPDLERCEELLNELSISSGRLGKSAIELDEETGIGYFHLCDKSSTGARTAIEHAKGIYEDTAHRDEFYHDITNVVYEMTRVRGFIWRFMNPARADELQKGATEYLATHDYKKMPNIWLLMRFIAAGNLSDRNLQKSAREFSDEFKRIDTELQPILERLAKIPPKLGGSNQVIVGTPPDKRGQAPISVEENDDSLDNGTSSPAPPSFSARQMPRREWLRISLAAAATIGTSAAVVTVGRKILRQPTAFDKHLQSLQEQIPGFEPHDVTKVLLGRLPETYTIYVIDDLEEWLAFTYCSKDEVVPSATCSVFRRRIGIFAAFLSNQNQEALVHELFHSEIRDRASPTLTYEDNIVIVSPALIFSDYQNFRNSLSVENLKQLDILETFLRTELIKASLFAEERVLEEFFVYLFAFGHYPNRSTILSRKLTLEEKKCFRNKRITYLAGKAHRLIVELLQSLSPQGKAFLREYYGKTLELPVPKLLQKSAREFSDEFKRIDEELQPILERLKSGYTHSGPRGRNGVDGPTPPAKHGLGGKTSDAEKPRQRVRTASPAILEQYGDPLDVKYPLGNSSIMPSHYYKHPKSGEPVAPQPGEGESDGETEPSPSSHRSPEQDLGSRTVLYELLDDQNRVKTEIQPEIDTEYRKERISDKSVSVYTGGMTLVELKKGEILRTEDALYGCLGFIGRGIKRNGQYMYLFAHMLPIGDTLFEQHESIARQLHLILSVIESQQLEKTEIYVRGIITDRDFIVMMLQSEDGTTLDESKNIWRTSVEVDRVQLDTKCFICTPKIDRAGKGPTLHKWDDGKTLAANANFSPDTNTAFDNGGYAKSGYTITNSSSPADNGAEALASRELPPTLADLEKRIGDGSVPEAEPPTPPAAEDDTGEIRGLPGSPRPYISIMVEEVIEEHGRDSSFEKLVEAVGTRLSVPPGSALEDVYPNLAGDVRACLPVAPQAEEGEDREETEPSAKPDKPYEWLGEPTDEQRRAVEKVLSSNDGEIYKLLSRVSGKLYMSYALDTKVMQCIIVDQFRRNEIREDLGYILPLGECYIVNMPARFTGMPLDMQRLVCIHEIFHTIYPHTEARWEALFEFAHNIPNRSIGKVLEGLVQSFDDAKLGFDMIRGGDGRYWANEMDVIINRFANRSDKRSKKKDAIIDDKNERYEAIFMLVEWYLMYVAPFVLNGKKTLAARHKDWIVDIFSKNGMSPEDIDIALLLATGLMESLSEEKVFPDSQQLLEVVLLARVIVGVENALDIDKPQNSETSDVRHEDPTPPTDITSLRQAAGEVDKTMRKDSVLWSSLLLSALKGLIQDTFLDRVTKLRLCVPIEVLKNSADLRLTLEGLEKMRGNVPFELVPTGVRPEDMKAIKNLNVEDIRQALNLPDKRKLTIAEPITESDILVISKAFQIKGLPSPKERAAIIRDLYLRRLIGKGEMRRELADGEFMAIAVQTDATTREEAEKLKKDEGYDNELQKNISIRLLVKPGPDSDVFSLSAIINDWLMDISVKKYSIVGITLPVPASMIKQLENDVRHFWKTLISA